jgi:hypothetical protein
MGPVGCTFRFRIHKEGSSGGIRLLRIGNMVCPQKKKTEQDGGKYFSMCLFYAQGAVLKLNSN